MSFFNFVGVNGVDAQHILHMVDKLGIVLGRNAPLLLQPRLEFVFFRSRRTVS